MPLIHYGFLLINSDLGAMQPDSRFERTFKEDKKEKKEQRGKKEERREQSRETRKVEVIEKRGGVKRGLRWCKI